MKKLKNNSFKKNQGFTLVELLIALAIFGTIGTVVISILFMTLRASKKSDILITLKQNGNTTISQVVKNIRYAKSLDSPASCITPVIVSSITVTSFADSGQTTFSCTSGPGATIASNGATLIDTSTAKVSDCSFTCSQVTQNDPPTINFTFKLTAGITTGLVETTGSIPFQTSVTMRNYSR